MSMFRHYKAIYNFNLILHFLMTDLYNKEEEF